MKYPKIQHFLFTSIKHTTTNFTSELWTRLAMFMLILWKWGHAASLPNYTKSSRKLIPLNDQTYAWFMTRLDVSKINTIFLPKSQISQINSAIIIILMEIHLSIPLKRSPTINHQKEFTKIKITYFVSIRLFSTKMTKTLMKKSKSWLKSKIKLKIHLTFHWILLKLLLTLSWKTFLSTTKNFTNRTAKTKCIANSRKWLTISEAQYKKRKK